LPLLSISISAVFSGYMAGSGQALFLYCLWWQKPLSSSTLTSISSGIWKRFLSILVLSRVAVGSAQKGHRARKVNQESKALPEPQELQE